MFCTFIVDMIMILLCLSNKTLYSEVKGDNGRGQQSSISTKLAWLAQLLHRIYSDRRCSFYVRRICYVWRGIFVQTDLHFLWAMLIYACKACKAGDSYLAILWQCQQLIC